MTREEIINNASILIIAGSETTATALSGATYFLLTNPEAYKRVQEEVRTAFARAEDMTLSSTGKLPYLHAVVEETLRMYPPVPGMLPRRTGAQGNVIDGHFVPPNVSRGSGQLFPSSARLLTPALDDRRVPPMGRVPRRAQLPQPRRVRAGALARRAAGRVPRRRARRAEAVLVRAAELPGPAVRPPSPPSFP